MKQKDAQVLCEVVDLMRQCPAVSPNPYEIGGTMKACRDFQKINSLAAEIIEKYAVFAANKAKLNDDKFDGAEYIELCESVYLKKLQELRDYVAKRKSEGWK